MINQCSKPSGWLGRFVLARMNASHSKVTDWGLRNVPVGKGDTILDVGCGGGRTVSKLAALATEGKVYGVDHSDESVAASKRMNALEIAAGRVEILRESVSRLPFSDGMFDLVTGVETHFWWPDLPGDVREVFRVVKPGGDACADCRGLWKVEGKEWTACREIRSTNGDEASECGGAPRASGRGGLLGCSDY